MDVVTNADFEYNNRQPENEFKNTVGRENEYAIPAEKEFRENISIMCNLSQKIMKTQHKLQRLPAGRLLFGLLLCCLLAAGCGGSDQVEAIHICTISLECSSILN